MKTFAYATAAAVACLATQSAAYNDTIMPFLGDCQASGPRLGHEPVSVPDCVGLHVHPALGLPDHGSS
ncbi:hypothetical protein ON010_g928 [Phytophthora cinnamomi]|nr:hypothetical protein ON010_g928 [Phytophthora cinnamomi]